MVPVSVMSLTPEIKTSATPLVVTLIANNVDLTLSGKPHTYIKSKID